MTRAQQRIAAALLAIALTLTLSACAESASKTREEAPAAESVQRLLELRASNSTDTAAYLQHVESTAVAEALVADSAGREKGVAPTPDWKQPRVTRQETSTAEVTVEWQESSEFSGWPAQTVFFVRLKGGHWRVIDAKETSSTAGAGD